MTVPTTESAPGTPRERTTTRKKSPQRDSGERPADTAADAPLATNPPAATAGDGAPPLVERRKSPDRRASVVDRRDGSDRPDETAAPISQFDRRRGPGRRRTDYRRDAEEGHMNEEQLEFLRAMDEYKRANGRLFPTWTEVLDVMLYLGYRKVAPIGEFKLMKGRQTPLRPTKNAADVEDEDGAEGEDLD